MRSLTRARAFTLVELVLVIVLLGIVATFSFRFVSTGAETFVLGANRIQTLEKSRFTIERLSRELRNAIPNSVRVSTATASAFQCIEFSPIKLSGEYRFVSQGIIEFKSLLADWEIPITDRLFIYPTRPVDIYSAPSSANESNFFSLQSPAQVNPAYPAEVRVNLQYDDDTYSVIMNSPSKRLYVSSGPVSYCLEGSNLIRYTNYGWQASQPTPNAGLVSGSGVLMGEGLTNQLNNRLPFAVDVPVLRRNSLVTIYLEFQSNSQENMFFNYEVHIPNAP